MTEEEYFEKKYRERYEALMRENKMLREQIDMYQNALLNEVGRKPSPPMYIIVDKKQYKKFKERGGELI